MTRHPSAAQRGFTLIEVIVALFIIVIILAALFRQINSVARTSVDLRERTLAQWIALDRLVELRVNGVPPVGQKSEGRLDYANEKWRWQSETLATANKSLVLIRVHAGLESAPKDSWSATVDSFKSTAIMTGGVPINWLGSSTGAPGAPGGPGTTPAPAPGSPTTPGTTPPPSNGGPTT
jgi:general secretion pathway protein I